MKFDDIRGLFVGIAPISEGKKEIEARAPYITHINNLQSMASRHSQIAKDMSAYGGGDTPEWKRHDSAAYDLGEASTALHKGDEKTAKSIYRGLDKHIRFGHKNDSEGSFAWSGPHSIKNTSHWLERDEV